MSMSSKPFLLIYVSLLLNCLSGAGFASEQKGELQQALALTPNIENGRNVYALCATCHYANGWGKEDGSFPVIAGQHRRVLIKQLADIRSRKRKNPTMFPFSDPATIGGVQAIADVTAYIASLPPDPEPGTGDGKQILQGKTLYEARCSMCHGQEGEGRAESFYPRLRGQHYAYMLRQLKWMQNGFRKNADPAMLEQLNGLSGQDIEALADFISRLGMQPKNNKD